MRHNGPVGQIACRPFVNGTVTLPRSCPKLCQTHLPLLFICKGLCKADPLRNGELHHTKLEQSLEGVAQTTTRIGRAGSRCSFSWLAVLRRAPFAFTFNVAPVAAFFLPSRLRRSRVSPSVLPCFAPPFQASLAHCLSHLSTSSATTVQRVRGLGCWGVEVFLWRALLRTWTCRSPSMMVGGWRLSKMDFLFLEVLIWQLTRLSTFQSVWIS